MGVVHALTDRIGPVSAARSTTFLMTIYNDKWEATMAPRRLAKSEWTFPEVYQFSLKGIGWW